MRDARKRMWCQNFQYFLSLQYRPMLFTRRLSHNRASQIPDSSWGSKSLSMSPSYILKKKHHSAKIWIFWRDIFVKFYFLLIFFQHESTIKSDVWSFGVTLWEILNVCHKEPFQNNFENEILNNLNHMCQHGVLKVSVQTEKYLLIMFKFCKFWKFLSEIM